MPKRTDIKNILIIGSGPIVIGQGCEFDYSGTQACKALREEGYGVVLINSNPATIMTDPDMADRTYIEPITPEFVEKILVRERDDGRPIDALLPTLGGQTGLNCAMETAEAGILDKYGVEMIGANAEAIHKAEDRTAFKETMLSIGLDVPRSGLAHTWEEAKKIIDGGARRDSRTSDAPERDSRTGGGCRVGNAHHTASRDSHISEGVQLPCCIRPAYTLGGAGGGFCHTFEEFEQIAKRGLEYSRVSEILIEESLYGWKEFELEVMRDRADNVVIICSIENIDPMGVHTGDSITVAPAQTLSDKEYQKMRDAAIAIIRAIGVDTGGCNIQFAVDPKTGRQVVIEMNPRVSRSSALASKATGYPIARIAAKLAVGYTLDELPNDITETTPASFEPTIDYIVVKMPRWTFEKFPEADETLTTQMKSVGEAMAIGRTFKEAFQKCIRSMEIKRYGFGLDANDAWLAWERDNDRPAASGGCPTGDGECPTSSNVGEAIVEKGIASPRPKGPGPPGPPARPDDLGAPLVGGSTATEAPPDTEEERAKSWPIPQRLLREKLTRPCQGRIYYIRYALKLGWSVGQINELTGIDPWFLEQMRGLVEFEDTLLGRLGRDDDDHTNRTATVREREDRDATVRERAPAASAQTLEAAKSLGYSDVQQAHAWDQPVDHCRATRQETRIRPTYKLVDTCAAEFEAQTPYYYSSHEPAVLSVKPTPEPRAPGRAEAPEPRALARANVHEEGTPPASHQCHDNNATPVATRCVSDEIRVTDKPKIIVLGGGPNRIGQGIEFDYCCCHASYAARKAGFESVMINSNPETVSTDYDTSDMLFFEPLTHEDVLNIIERLNGEPLVPEHGCHGQARLVRAAARDGDVAHLRPPRGANATDAPTGFVKGVIVQFGGQTPLNLAQGLKDAGVPIIGTQPEMIHLAEDREEFQKVLRDLSLLQPPNGIARNRKEALTIAEQIGYPVLVRPSYVLGGRGMRICNNPADLNDFLDEAFGATDRAEYAASALRGGRELGGWHGKANPGRGHVQHNPILIDKFLSDAIEVDVDAVADYGRDSYWCENPSSLDRRRENPSSHPPATQSAIRNPQSASSNPSPTCMVAGILEHIEEAGIHSGDSTCVLPPFSLGRMVIEELFRSTKRLAKRLRVCGAINVQYAILNRTVYVLEVNPRASRTLPFIAKATGVPWAEVATRVMLGEPLVDVLASHGVTETPWPEHTAIKAPVFPFEKFAGVDVILGPEMRSTGEVMSIAPTFGLAFAKAQIATGLSLPTSGNVLISVNDPDKPRIVSVARDLYDMGFTIYSTVGTRTLLAQAGIPAMPVSKRGPSASPPTAGALPNTGAMPDTATRPSGSVPRTRPSGAPPDTGAMPQPTEGGRGPALSTPTSTPFLKDLIEDGTLDLLINTPIHTGRAFEEGRWRAAATAHRVPLITTLAGARAAVAAIRALRNSEEGGQVAALAVKPLQAYFHG